jgi:uncharacterized membrane protein
MDCRVAALLAMTVLYGLPMLRALPRIWKHSWLNSRAAARALPPAALARLAALVAQSEAAHTGEIRIAVEGGLPLSYLRRHASPRERAINLFGKLRVWDTQDNNGVLIYLLLADHAVEVVADRGLNAALPADFWPELIAPLRPALAAQQYEAALAAAIAALSAALVQHFPLVAGQSRSNTLPDAPVLL